MVLISRVRKDESGDFSIFQDGEANQDTCMKEDLSYSLDIVVLRFADNWGEGLDGGFDFGVIKYANNTYDGRTRKDTVGRYIV